MPETTHRVLRLLSLLESRPAWPGGELAARLEVTPRTVRRDVARLRALGYPVHSEPGAEGGYRLGAGARLPPLVLEDDEAVALVACLRMGAMAGQDSVGEAALRALGKLDRVLPPRLRGLAEALDSATQALPRSRPEVDWRVLSQLALAHREHHLVRFDYTRADGLTTSREVEPAALVTQGERWYLHGYDRGRADWRVFRLDRVRALRTTTWSFEPRTPPPFDHQRDLSSRCRCVATIRVPLPVEEVIGRIPASQREAFEPTETGCRGRVGAASWAELALHLLWLAQGPGTRPEVDQTQPGAEELSAAFAGLGAAARALVPGGRPGAGTAGT